MGDDKKKSRTMEQFYVFANSEDSLNIFNDKAGGRFRVYFPNPYVLDGTWECALLEVTFVPSWPHRREGSTCTVILWMISTSGIRTFPGLQSLSVLSEDVTDVTFENTIYHRVRGGIGQQIEISMRDDNLQICRFKDVHVFCLVHFHRR